jgi:hypothetical protein
MSCPPGTVLNPYTLKCVRAAGRKGRELLQQGVVAEAQVYQQYAFDRIGRRTRKAPPQPKQPNPCPPGTVRNPATRRCIKEAGKVYRSLYPQQVDTRPVPIPINPTLLPIRRQLSEPPLRLPVGTAEVAPLADRATILGWASANCTNTSDPITGAPFASAESLQELIRLHNRTCALAPPLHVKVAAEHKEGRVAMMPGDPTTAMTLDDFTALRNAMRRRNPEYKLPGRKHFPPPPSWKLYIASDNRSGPDYASILYVDVSKAKSTMYGVQYPLDSIMVDLGVIPVQMGSTYTPTMFVELFKQLDAANKLLIAVPGGWKPVAGLPYTKKDWTSNKEKKIVRLYTDLTTALTATV